MTDALEVAKGIWTIPNLFTPEECDAWIQRAESLGFEPAPIQTEMGPQRMSEIRNNSRVILDDPEAAAALWQRIAQLVPAKVQGRQAVGLNERLRFYRYDVGQRFKFHGDATYRRDNGEQSLLTFMVYLNDDFLGGYTMFDAYRVEPHKGMGLLFQQWLKHSGTEVTEGRKYLLRSDVMYRKPD